MFQLSKSSNNFKLLRWSKQLPFASAADPLGLNLRVSARLSDELLHCITSITPRARYYSFFPWAFQNYNDHERSTKSDRGRINGVLVRERAMVLGAVLHHDGQPCAGGALGGSDKATKVDAQRKRPFELSTWEHLGASEGQFGAAYKGSLINLGVFDSKTESVKDEVDAETAELDQDTQDVDVRELSPLGRRLAGAFDQSVRTTEYVKQKWTLKNSVDLRVLAKFGARAGLCEIANINSSDRDVLRNVFFAKYPEMERPAHNRRRMSLLLLLECINQARTANASFDNGVFSEMCYFGVFHAGEDRTKRRLVRIPAQLTDIYERWRIFYFQNYLAVALQSLLVACLGALRDRPAGVKYDDLVQGLNPSGLGARFVETFARELPKEFFALSGRETLSVCGIQGRSPKPLRIDAALSERNLEILLVNGEASSAACVALSAMLLYQVLVRYDQSVPVAYKNWCAQQVSNPAADIAIPEVAKFLSEEIGENWIDEPNHKIIHRVVWRFVVRQHQTMSYERGFGGSAPLFHVDGSTIIGTEMGFDDPAALNPRLRSALQILSDLGLIEDGDGIGWRLTPEGGTWLTNELKHENAL
jgi:hypothetical protein